MPMALPTIASNIRRQVDAEIAKANVTFLTSLEIDDTLARLKFVEAGNSVTIAPLSSLDGRPTIRTIPIAEARLTLIAGLVSQRGVTLGSAAQALADTIRANFPSSTGGRPAV
jgi:DNA-binding transcriptional LysR family regulator